MKQVNYVGQRFGRLIAIEKIKNGKIGYSYRCKCDCGNETIVSYSNLFAALSGKGTKSCGCLKREVITRAKRMSDEVVISNSIWRIYKRNAKIRSYAWCLSKEEFLNIITSSCYYCGIDAGNTIKARWGKDRTAKFNGVDRLDNSIGYNKENCVAACRICNCAKSELSLIEFKDWVKRTAKNLEII